MSETPEPIDNSMVIDGSDTTTTGAGAPPKAESVRDSVAAAFNEANEDNATDPENGDNKPVDAEEAEDKEVAAETEKKDKDAEKAEAKDDKEKVEKPKQDKAPTEKPNVEQETPAGKPKVEAPESFSERAKEQWRNVPHPVREDVSRTITEYTKQIESFKPVAEKYESIRRFDEMAQQVGKPLDQVLEGYVRTEQALAMNPLKGLNDIVRNYFPPKADGSPTTLQDVAQYVAQIGPQGLHQQFTQAQQQEMQMLQQQQVQAQIEAAQRQAVEAQERLIQETVTGPFAASHEHYHAVKGTIALILQSGIIDPNLSPLQKMEQAYDLAVLKHGLQSTKAQTKEPQPRAGDFGGGSPQLKPSLGGVSNHVSSDAETGESIEDSLRKEMRKMKL